MRSKVEEVTQLPAILDETLYACKSQTSCLMYRSVIAEDRYSRDVGPVDRIAG